MKTCVERQQLVQGTHEDSTVTEQKIIDLETKVAYQEHAIEALQTAVYEQQIALASLTAKFAKLQMLVGVPDTGPANDPPPHY